MGIHDDARAGYERMRASEAAVAEDARRLSRYPEAIALLAKLEQKIGGDLETALFLAAEPAERGEGGVG